MIHAIATIQVKPGARPAFLDAFLRNRPHVLAEEGCLAYGPAVDTDSGLAQQDPPRDDVVVVIEQWESLERLHAHLQAPHMATYREEVRDWVEAVSLQVLTPVVS